MWNLNDDPSGTLNQRGIPSQGQPSGQGMAGGILGNPSGGGLSPLATALLGQQLGLQGQQQAPAMGGGSLSNDNIGQPILPPMSGMAGGIGQSNPNLSGLFGGMNNLGAATMGGGSGTGMSGFASPVMGSGWQGGMNSSLPQLIQLLRNANPNGPPTVSASPAGAGGVDPSNLGTM